MIKKLFWFIVIIFAVGGAWKMFGDKLPTSAIFWKSEQPFYAVRLVNGQVYYGRIKSLSDSTIKMEDVYYFETYQAAQPPATSKNFALQGQGQTIYRLVRSGSDKPTMTDHDLFVNRTAVLFWEKLNDDSDIVTMIVKSEEQK